MYEERCERKRFEARSLGTLLLVDSHRARAVLDVVGAATSLNAAVLAGEVPVDGLHRKEGCQRREA